MKIIYQKGLTLELWHDFYLGQPSVLPAFLPSDYSILDRITLIPSQDCDRSLRNLRWVFRPQSAGANLFVDVQDHEGSTRPSTETFQTVVSVDRGYRLCFWLMVSDRYFSNYTNLPLANARRQIYYFSNQWNNRQGNKTFLSQPLPAYRPGERYRLGQLVTHGGNTLEALRPLESAPAVPNPDDWAVLPASQYVGEGDRLPRQRRYWRGTIPSANPGDLVSLRVQDGNDTIVFTTEIVIPDRHAAGDAFPVSLDFASLSPGRYQLLQQEEVIDEFVFADSPEAQTALGLVEIFLESDRVNPEVSPTRRQNQQTVLQPQTYVIRFKNRATRWRYRYQRPHGCTLTNLPDDFTLIDDRTYATTRPIGLRQRPDRRLVDCQDSLLPSPTVTQIKPETDEDRSIVQIFSDVYL